MEKSNDYIAPLLFLVAILCFIIVFPIAITYAFIKNLYLFKFKKILLNSAISIDLIGNTIAEQMFNDIFITKFGNSAETISSVLGKNQQSNTLTKIGKGLSNILDYIDKDHCKKSIKTT